MCLFLVKFPPKGQGFDIFLKFLAVKKIVDNQTLDMEVIVNHKTLDNGQNVIQLETAVGAAMKCFDGCLGEYNYFTLHVIYLRHVYVKIVLIFQNL